MKTATLTFITVATMATTAFAVELGSVDCSATSIVLDFTGAVSVAGADVTAISIGSSADISSHTPLSSSTSLVATDSDTATISLSAGDQSANMLTLTGNSCFVTITNGAFNNVGSASIPE